MYPRTLESAVVSTDRCDLLCLDLPRAEQLRHALNLELTTQAAARARALGDPTRMLVAAALRDGGELCVCDLSWIVERSQGLVSHHLRALRAQELVRSRRDGKMVLYALTDAGRVLLDAHLDHTTVVA